jgi:hypothetical protein
MVVHNFYLAGVSVPPLETDTPLVIDPDAVLPDPRTLQRLETIPSNLRQIGQARRRMETREPRASSGFDTGEAPAAESPVERIGFLAPKRQDHLHHT